MVTFGFNKGEQHPEAKLTDENVKEIRKAYREGNITQKELGKRYGVTQASICRILNGHSWTHLPGMWES